MNPAPTTPSSRALRLSLVANLALAGLVAVLLWRSQAAAPVPATLPRPTAFARVEPSRMKTIAAELPAPSTGTKNTPAAMAQLEQMGIPHEVLVNVLLEDLNRRQSRRLLELQKEYAPRLVPDREMRALARESEATQERELKAAFGEAGYRAWDKEQMLRDLNRARVPGDELPMSDAEAEQAYRLQKEFTEQTKQLQQAMEEGVADKDDAGALQAEAQQTLDRQLEQLLGKERLGQLRGNTAPTTEVYRTYGDLNPTPDQAEAVVQAEGSYRAREAALAERLKASPADAANVTAELQAMNEAHDENLRQIFGAEAYDNLKRQSDPTYQTLQQFAETWGLNDQEIQSVYETLHPFQDQAGRVRAAAELSAAAGSQ